MTVERRTPRMGPAERSASAAAEDYPFQVAIQTRWSDNDMFGHINNVEYYRFFETAVVEFLRGPGRLDLSAAPVVPFVAESRCQFRRPLSWPGLVRAGLRVDHIGTRSVRYGLALFADTEEPVGEAAADGHWVHVFVDRTSNQPAPIPPDLRAVFAAHAVP
jgi:acyl-CoA thioester hydrolase